MQFRLQWFMVEYPSFSDNIFHRKFPREGSYSMTRPLRERGFLFKGSHLRLSLSTFALTLPLTSSPYLSLRPGLDCGILRYWSQVSTEVEYTVGYSSLVTDIRQIHCGLFRRKPLTLNVYLSLLPTSIACF